MLFKRMSLRTGITTIVILAVSPALLFILFTTYLQHVKDRSDAEETALKAAQLAANDHQRYLDSSHQLLDALSKLKVVTQHNTVACTTLFTELLKEFPLYANLFAVLPNGDLFCGAITPARPINLAGQAWFQQALKARILAVNHQAETSTIPHSPLIVLAHPVQDEHGAIQGVVGIALDPALLEPHAAGPLPPGWAEVVLDKTGQILARYPEGETTQMLPPIGSSAFTRLIDSSNESRFESPDQTGVPRLYAVAHIFSPMEGEQLTVLVSVPTKLAFGVANQALTRNLFWFGAVILLALLGAVVAGEIFVLRQVRELQIGVQHLKTGDFAAQVQVASGAREIQAVALAFNQMAGAVQQRDTALHQARSILETRVEQRTAELAQANHALLAEIAERQRKEEILRQTQDQLIQVEKMNALGRLAAALAHEINNPLQAVQTYLELLSLGAPLPPATQEEYIQIAHSEILRLGRLVEGILHFARPAHAERTSLSVVELIEQTIRLTSKRLQHAHIQLVTDLQPTPSILAAPDQLVQVFINLLLNAVEASAQEGSAIHIATQSNQNVVTITFANSGLPIPDEDLQRIFEPFFTTKPNGTGLGLSISHTLVRDHGGSLRVENTEGEYAVIFTVTLPVYASHLTPKQEEALA